MSIRVDSSSLIAGAVVVGDPGLGVLAESVPSSGEHGAGYLYASLEFPADAGKEVRGLITTWPTLGTLKAYEDSSFEYDGASDTFAFQMYVDGVAVGTPQTVTVAVGTVAPVTGHAISIGYSPLVFQPNPVVITPDTGHGLGTGYVVVINQFRLILPLTGSGVARGYVPTITQGVTISITPVTGHGVGSGYIPIIIQGALVSVIPVTGHGVGIGYVPGILQGSARLLTPLTGHSIARGYIPNVTANPRRIGPNYVLYLKVNS